MFAASGGSDTERVSSIVTIPAGSSSGNKNFEPEVIKVIIGINNTVRRINKDDVPNAVVASNDDDSVFQYHQRKRTQHLGAGWVL